MDEPFELPINGVLDLHTFRPQDVQEVLLEYLAECRKRGLLEVRVIHGKGIGQLRQTVHTLLARQPEEVASYAQASEAFGGWGATIVHLRPSVENTASGKNKG
jgi:DNA-nicking Smr family endonuclease